MLKECRELEEMIQISWIGGIPRVRIWIKNPLDEKTKANVEKSINFRESGLLGTPSSNITI